MNEIELITWACIECEGVFAVTEGTEDATCPYCQSEAVGAVSQGGELMGVKIESVHGFDIYKCHDGHTIHNGKYHWSDAHTHGIKSLEMAHQIIDNVRHERIPTTRRDYLFDSHIRLAGPTAYREQLIALKERRLNRRQDYFNPHLKDFRGQRGKK